MINYSIVMRSVNSNLIDINQAKGRINKAKEAGIEPNPADVELANTELQTKAYAIAQYADVMTIEKFAKHIATHGCVYSRADISAILYMAVDCMRELLLEGKKIRLGDLGDFSVNIQSKGADTPDKFNAAAHITAVNVNWDCGQEFKNLLADAEFNLVASRSAQAAVLKAIKAGETTVDLSKPVNENDPSTDPGDDGNSTPTPPNGGTNGSNGSNSQNGSTDSTNPGGSSTGTDSGSTDTSGEDGGGYA